MAQRLLFIHALTPLHPGSGQGVGAIDLPIHRERATNLPVLPGSSIKGCLRDAMAAELAAGRRDRATEPAVEKEYGIQAVTSRIDDLYEQLAYRTAWRTRMRRRRNPRKVTPLAAARG